MHFRWIDAVFAAIGLLLLLEEPLRRWIRRLRR
jgi:hypothetical protein